LATAQTMKYFVRILLFWCVVGVALADDGKLLNVIVPPSGGDRFQHAEFSCWLPEVKGPLKAIIIHQHGCTNASPDKHPPVTMDFHWRALARKHGCALLAPMYHVAGGCDEWNDPDSGSERALLAALGEISQGSGHAELKDAPWVLWGHSGGSSWSAQMIVRHPGRVLAASFRGGCHKQFGAPEFRAKFAPIARELPLLFVWGKRETVPTSSHYVSWEPMNAMFREMRSQGGMVGRLMDPLSEHGCDDSRLVVIPFFDAVLTARLADQKLPGALVDMASLQDRELNDASRHDPKLAWLPNAGLAKLWREFSEKGTLQPVKPKLAAPKLTAVRDAAGMVQLNWNVVPARDGGVRTLRIQRDGMLWKELGVKPGARIATSRDAPPEGLRALGISDESKGAHVYTVTFLDVAGNESPASEAAKVSQF
jgi:pimeloyl-ACP methyl ester carboxylesterase